MTGKRLASSQRGFTYIALLLMVAMMGIWLAATANVWHLRQQREKEQQLLAIGHEFRQALEHYARTTVGTGRRLPLRLEDLLLDERFPDKRRHLRRIYIDPMTGDSQWGLVRQADGQIVGVHSLSTDAPVKTAGFVAKDSGLADKTSYADWVFLAAVPTAVPRTTTTPVVPRTPQPATR